MGLWSRIMMFFRIKTSSALERAEDPRQVLEYAYGQQQEFLRKVRQGLVDVATSKAQLEQQSKKLRPRIPQMDEQARRALNAGREDLARIALQRKHTALAEVEGLDLQIAEVAQEEQKLTAAERQLAARIEEFRTRRGVISARYTAAEAQVRVSETLTGVSEEFAELNRALGRAEEKTERMTARASALDALVNSGALALPGGEGADVVERDLKELEVEDELAALKRQLGQGETPPSLEEGPTEGGNDRQ